MIRRNPEVVTQPLFFDKIEDVAYEKVLCIIYPNFSLYEITTFNEYFSSVFWISRLDYVASENSMVVSEDGLPRQTKTLIRIRIVRLVLSDFARMVNIGPAYKMRNWLLAFEKSDEQDIPLQVLLLQRPLLAKAGLLNDTELQVEFGKTSLTILNFFHVSNFNRKFCPR